MSARLAVVLAVAAAPLALSVFGAPVANADCHEGPVTYDPGADGLGAGCTDTGTDPGNGGSGGSGGSGDVSGPGTTPVDLGPVQETYYTPSCAPNGPPDTGADALCMAATNSTLCADDELLMQTWTRWVDRQTGEPVPGDDGFWDFGGTTCLGPDDPAPGIQPPEITADMVYDFASTQVPPTTVNAQPADESYVRVPNNFYADSSAVIETLTVLGRAIPVTYTPVEHTWQFGDQSTATGAGIQDADVGQPGAVEHAYLSAGDYEVTVTTSWTVTFTLPGQGEVTPEGTLTSTSAAYPLQVGEIQSVVDATG